MASLILEAWPSAMLPSMRAMIVKQGLSCSDCGKAELNAVGSTTRLHCCRADGPPLAWCGAQAFSNLGDMMTAVGVPMWGYLYLVVPARSPHLAHSIPVFPPFLRVFTVSPRRPQRAASRNPGPRDSGKGGRTPFLRSG